MLLCSLRRYSSLPLACLALGFLSLTCIAQDSDPDPVALFNQGQDAHEKNNFEKALIFYKQALEIAPEFPEAEFQSGNALSSLGRNEEAEQAFRRAVNLRPDWSLAFAQLGSTLVRNNKFDEAGRILARAINLDNRNFPAYVALAELRVKTKASPDVLKDLLSRLQFLASQAKPNASILAARGALERALGDSASAKISLEKSLALDKRNVFALTERIELALTEGDSARAIEDSKFLVTTAPNSVVSKLLLARAYAGDGKISDALKILDSLVAENIAVAELKSAIVASNTTDVSLLEKEIATNPKNVVALSRLCSAFRLSNPSKSLDYCRRASELEPTNINHAVGYGAALVQAKQYSTAIGLFRRVLQFAPDNYTAHSNLATALFQSKRFVEAKAEYQWLIEKKPDLAIAYYFLAITHDSLAEYVDAHANYRQFLQRAETAQHKLEIDKVNLRLPILERQIKKGGGKKPR